MFVGLIFVVLFIATIFLIIFVAIKFKTKGKIVVFFIERDKTLSFKIFKPRHQSFTFTKGGLFNKHKEKELYVIDTEKILLVSFPFGGPSFLKQTVPALIYTRNNPDPLDPADINIPLRKGQKTSKELSTMFNEKVVDEIARAQASDGKKEKIPAWVVGCVCAILVLICIVLIFMLKQQVASLAAAVQALATGGLGK
jgi:hypothetical protein